MVILTRHVSNRLKKYTFRPAVKGSVQLHYDGLVTQSGEILWGSTGWRNWNRDEVEYFTWMIAVENCIMLV